VPAVVEITLAVGVWSLDGFTPVGAVIGMRPSHLQALGLNVPDESHAPGFPALPDAGPGLWIVTCPAELPAYLDDEPMSPEEALAVIGLEQLLWLSDQAVWRPANERDLYILREEVPPGERT
jgi:hypothetical protein